MTSSDFQDAVLAGLGASPRTLPCRFFYDREGSLLFEEICALPEYYLTRTEDAILRAHADEIAADLPVGPELVELGSGTAVKTRHLLSALLRRHDRLRYVPVDISGEMLEATASTLRNEYPRLEVSPLAAEYSAAMSQLKHARHGPRAVLFLGSNLGNFDSADAVQFLAQVRSIMESGDRALLGLDLRKDPRILVAAYDDSAGVTARFNLNLLRRINHELGADFDLQAFQHRALYNETYGRIEMHLVSRRPQIVHISGRCFGFAAGENIHTENSYKYEREQVRHMAAAARLDLLRVWTDPQTLFSTNLFGTIDP